MTFLFAVDLVIFCASPALLAISVGGIILNRVKTRDKFSKENKVMKSQNAVAKARSTPTTLSQPEPPGEEATRHAVTPEEIRLRAFEIHCERGGIHGFDLDDWLQAERELQEQYRTGEEGKKN